MYKCMAAYHDVIQEEGSKEGGKERESNGLSVTDTGGTAKGG